MHVFLSVIPVILAACCTGTTFYRKVGDEVILRPDAGPNTGPLTSILWKHGDDIAIQWDADGVEAYRQFQHRAKLDNVSGELTITGLTKGDSGAYTPEINFVSSTPTHLAVILSVPEPTVLISCDAERTTCTLTCSSNTTGAEPVTYTWMLGPSVENISSMERVIQKDTSSADEFKCELENPVSKKSSLSTRNPFLTSGEGGLKVNTGLTLLICLLTALVVLVLIHKCRTGVWFFQKGSMPWDADFWKKQERQRRDANESNGTTTHQEKAQAEEEMPMT
ncbi:uncharacterized protein LOC144056807 [Vanacampus margaritifer]